MKFRIWIGPEFHFKAENLINFQLFWLRRFLANPPPHSTLCYLVYSKATQLRLLALKKV